MFGLALRTYHAKVRRLSESSTFSGRSLWEAIVEFIQDKNTVSRGEVLLRFRNDDSAVVRAILKDLVDGGLVFRTGQGERTTYRAARPEEYAAVDATEEREGLVSFVWVGLNRFGPATAAELSGNIPLSLAELAHAFETLVVDGRARRVGAEEPARYECTHCIIPLGSAQGWEASVFDHYQAMVTAICNKLSGGATVSAKDDSIGGSTYGFVVWPGHPLAEEVLGLLGSMRERVSALRARVDDYNAEHAAPGSAQRVIAYVGQNVVELGTDQEST
jgi:hypothetical protein